MTDVATIMGMLPASPAARALLDMLSAGTAARVAAVVTTTALALLAGAYEKSMSA